MSESSPPDFRRKDLIGAIKDEDPVSRDVTTDLDQIPNAYEQAQVGLNSPGKATQFLSMIFRAEVRTASHDPGGALVDCGHLGLTI